MAFTHPATPPAGNLTNIQVALWFARERSGDKRERGGRVDEDWFFDLEGSAAIVTLIPNDETQRPFPVAVGQRMYRPFFAAAAHIRAIMYRIKGAGQTQFDDLDLAADALEQRQIGLDTQYGLRAVVTSDPVAGRPSIDLERT